MKVRSIAQHCLMLSLTLLASVAAADPVDIDPADPQNGIFDIYSSTFDGPPILGGDPFFGATPPPNRAIRIVPTPSGVVANTVPGGFPVPPAAGSFLDLSLSVGNTMLTIAGGTIAFPGLGLIINEGEDSQTDVSASDPGIVFDALPVTVPVDGNGVAVFEVDAPGGPIAVDFSNFSDIVGPGDCTGALCPIIPLLTLDMLKYRLIVDYDPTFSSFTADFSGQTANASMVFATLNSVVPAPNIMVTDSVPPADDLQIPFGDVPITEPPPPDETVTITNIGTADLVLEEIAVTNPLAPPFSITNDDCSAKTLPPIGQPNNSCTLTIQFNPSTTGLEEDTFDIQSNDPDTPTTTVRVSGIGVAPAIMVTPNPVEFRTVTVNPPTPPEITVTITNGGTADLVLEEIAVANPLAPPFSINTDDCLDKTPLSPIGQPNNSCTLTIQFNPSTTGREEDSFDIQSNDPDTPTTTIDVEGTGTTDLVATITVTDTVDFGPVIEMTTAEQTVTVTSSGTKDLEIFAIAVADPLSAPFSILTDNCSMQILPPLPPDNTCTLTVQFAPAGTGLVEPDSFDIPSSDLDKPTATVNVSGTGAPTPFPEITVTDSVPPEDDLNIPFGDVIETMSADETVTVKNSGTADLVLDQITVAGPPGPFSVENDTCSMQTLSPLPPDNRCTLTIGFAPPATGMFSGSVDIPSNDPNVAIVTVIVDGTGTPGPAPNISVTAVPVDPDDDLMMPFGNVTEATAWDGEVTITNVGNGNLVMGMIAETDTLENTFSILNDNCSAQIIAPEASCAVGVRFLPVRVDNFTDSFDIPSNDPDEPSLTFRVSGSGVAVGTGVISLTPEGADSGFFGSALRPATLLALLGLIATSLRRRRYH
jgi:hypothetical protein